MTEKMYPNNCIAGKKGSIMRETQQTKIHLTGLHNPTQMKGNISTVEHMITELQTYVKQKHKQATRKNNQIKL